MEKLNFREDEHHQNNLESSLFAKKLRKYGLIASVAINVFLASCGDGKKETISQKTLENLKNKIENPDLEKVSPELLRTIEQKIDQYNKLHNSNNGIQYASLLTIKENWEDGKMFDAFYLTSDDSLITIDAELNCFQGNNRKKNPLLLKDMKHIHTVVDKKIHAVIKYVESIDEFVPEKDGLHYQVQKDTSKIYVVTSDGSIEMKGYSKGSAQEVIEKASQSDNLNK